MVKNNLCTFFAGKGVTAGDLSQAVYQNETFWLRLNVNYAAHDVEHVNGISVCTKHDIAVTKCVQHGMECACCTTCWTCCW